METEPLTIAYLSKLAKELEEARQISIKRYQDYRQAKEDETMLRFQLQADLMRYATINEQKENK